MARTANTTRKHPPLSSSASSVKSRVLGTSDRPVRTTRSGLVFNGTAKGKNPQSNTLPSPPTSRARPTKRKVPYKDSTPTDEDVDYETQTETTDSDCVDSEPLEAPKAKRQRQTRKKAQETTRRSTQQKDQPKVKAIQKKTRRPQKKNLTPRPEPSANTVEFTFQTTGPQFPKAPSARFPWSCTLPAIGQPASALQSCFSEAPNADLVRVLGHIGVSVTGKTRSELIKLCMAYASLIRKLSSTLSNTPPEPDVNVSHSRNPTPGPSAIHPEVEVQPTKGTPPIPNVSPAPPESHHSIEFNTPTTNLRPRRANTTYSRRPIPSHSLSNAIPDSDCEQTSHVPLASPSDESTPKGPRTTSASTPDSHDHPCQILNVLKSHSQQLAELREDFNLILQHQRDMNEKLEEISEGLKQNGAKKVTRSKREPAVKKAAVKREGKLKELVHHHFATLFGLRPKSGHLRPPKVPPSPPTEGETKRWLRNLSDDADSQDEMSDSHYSSQSASTNSTPIPGIEQYPYRHGPALLESREYEGLQAEQKQPDVILEALRGYAQEGLARSYREAHWPASKISEKATKQCQAGRRTNLKNARIQTATGFDLVPIIPIIKVACSDDETDDEVAPTQGPTEKAQVQKFCVVRDLAWRNKDLTIIFQWLDKQHELQSKANPKGQQGNLPRVRRRPVQPVNSSILPGKGLPKIAFDQEWLDLKDPVYVKGLKIKDESASLIKRTLKLIKSK
ncbi:hypothetical protein MJO28_006563 [Puccinia striiformis f. sp. tritici]|uniref:Uncharacterized protein n=1 Tax=Puccinia striiformis f. sp. tritici TaxID=168172 RepID=A0ACC0EHE4_9BASI|nr:hypothetical protein MJO28_006563 [Puccinia striiformis f. sp. tritici]